jgi:hypothetical protein
VDWLWVVASFRGPGLQFDVGDVLFIQPMAAVSVLVFLLGPVLVIGGLYRLWAVKRTTASRIAAGLGAVPAALLLLVAFLVLTRPPLSQFNIAGEDFDVSGIDHPRRAGYPSIQFSSDLASAAVFSDSCGRWEASLVVDRNTDAMRFGAFRRVDLDPCVLTAAMTKVIAQLGTVRTWRVENTEAIQLRGDRNFHLY